MENRMILTSWSGVAVVATAFLENLKKNKRRYADHEKENFLKYREFVSCGSYGKNP